MILDENSVSCSDFQTPPRVQFFAAELFSEPCPPSRSSECFQEEKVAISLVDWACLATVVNEDERLEHERLQDVEKELVGRIIEEYEHALQNGLPPHRAIASILEWASRECPRLLP